MLMDPGRSESRRAPADGSCARCRLLWAGEGHCAGPGNSDPIRVGVYTDLNSDLGEAPILKLNRNDPRTWIRYTFLRSGSINAPTILHEVGHGITTPQRPYGLLHSDSVKVPRYGRVMMCQAAHRCVGSMSNRGC